VLGGASKQFTFVNGTGKLCLDRVASGTGSNAASPRIEAALPIDLTPAQADGDDQLKTSQVLLAYKRRTHAFQGRCGDVRLQGGREHPVRHTERKDGMPESTYDVIQLIGTSQELWEKAAAQAVEQASKSLRDVRVADIDMQLDPKEKVEAYRAKVKLSFKYEAKSYSNSI
jgi:dodecin